MKLHFLGTGTSTGVPQIGCQCEVCQSHDRRDKRLRSSLFIEIGNSRILIDCGPDFRQQALKYIPFGPIDGVCITHEHYDHIGGLDDLRPFGKFSDVNIYAEKNVANAINTRMPYCFAEHKYLGVPKLTLHTIDLEPFYIKNTKIIPIRVMHGKLPILGFRIGDMAYLTDLRYIPEKEYLKLEDLKVLIITALRVKPHPTHENIEEAISQVKRIKPEKAYFIHMSHDFGLHEAVQKTLPPNITIAYDGFTVEL